MKKKTIQVKDVDNVSQLAWEIFITAVEFMNGADSTENDGIDSRTKCILEGKQYCMSSSMFILRSLSIELFLKTLYLIDRKMLIYGHDHAMIYKMLDRKTQIEIVEGVMEFKIAKLTDDKSKAEINLISALEESGDNFTRVRYMFEDYSDLTEEEGLRLLYSKNKSNKNKSSSNPHLLNAACYTLLAIASRKVIERQIG